MKHLFVLNPVAGGRKNGCAVVRLKIECFMKEMGADYEIYETSGPMDAAEKVKREALKGAPLRVYACGGDGTLSECVHGAAGYRNAAVTHYPCGTGNDFVRMFGEDSSLFLDLGALTCGEAEPIDIIDVNGRRCVNICSVGIDARVGTDVHKYSRLPFIGGTGGYVVSLLVNFIKGVHRPLRLVTEEGEEEGRYTLICACNGRYYGGGFNPTKTALPNDGALEFMIVGKVSRIKVALLLGDYAKGGFEKHPDVIRCLHGRRIRVESDKEFVINADGEKLVAKEAVIRLIPGGVNFIYPKGCRRLNKSEVNIL
ncbi:MAG: diacylglycerol/lipid kinase family protein [Oscillospiraceae bacterium]